MHALILTLSLITNAPDSEALLQRIDEVELQYTNSSQSHLSTPVRESIRASYASHRQTITFDNLLDIAHQWIEFIGFANSDPYFEITTFLRTPIQDLTSFAWRNQGGYLHFSPFIGADHKLKVTSVAHPFTSVLQIEYLLAILTLFEGLPDRLAYAHQSLESLILAKWPTHTNRHERLSINIDLRYARAMDDADKLFSDFVAYFRNRIHLTSSNCADVLRLSESAKIP